ncbi:isoprenyl transferase [Rhodococcus sp. X156]|uniref:isoprenyl transferase n=1 Tax=Rhodococcus sp. X156 TaxID=2499145 RepID=UPI000FD781D2|nr:isoprenyl transferase [Rhodococcus sp. X156]
MTVRETTSNLAYAFYERHLLRQLRGVERPRHIGVIMDGNRRWAREAGFDDVSHGHRVGAQKIAGMLGWCDAAGVEVVTLYMLATDNLRRDPEELEALLHIITDVVDELSGPEANWQLRIVGALHALPEPFAKGLRAAAERTKGRPGVSVNIAVGYGGRQEIVDGVRSLLAERAAAGVPAEQLAATVTVEAIGQHLYTSGQPDPDLVIRTSGEQRLSGFLLWQSAYSEFYFCETYWPEFRRVDFLRALRDYGARHRRYGS